MISHNDIQPSELIGLVSCVKTIHESSNLLLKIVITFVDNNQEN
jgi:hypothetical protein